MTNVIGFPKRDASTRISGSDDYWPNLASQIRGIACNLIRAIDDLQRDGHQSGSDAIGASLNDLELLRQRWFDDPRARGEALAVLLDRGEEPF